MNQSAPPPNTTVPKGNGNDRVENSSKSIANPADAPIVPFDLYGVEPDVFRNSFLGGKAVKVKAEFVSGGLRGDRPLKAVTVDPDDLLEIEFATGERLWMRADEYYGRFGGVSSRDFAGKSGLIVPEHLDLLSPGIQARGFLGWVVKSLKVLGIDPAQEAAVTIAKYVENRVPTDEGEKKKRPGPGLYRCSLVTDAFSLTPVNLADEPVTQPYLVFIHGTGSSTWKSFGDLWSKERQAELDALRELYGERVLAFDHATLTQSPLQNALDLARRLPQKARLHLITHSRGGLVGELLCRAGVMKEVSKGDPNGGTKQECCPFGAREFELFKGDENGEKKSNQLDLLKKLHEELKSKQFKVERFVRVACPALGTTLASRRLDRWFSVIGTLAGSSFPKTPLFDMFQDLGDFVAAVIKERTDPAALPGLEAVMPESSFMKLINWPHVSVPGDLVVISGDIDPEAWWARLMVFVTDRYYESDHDLVVNTPSMYGGAKRSGQTGFSFHKGPQVNHFRYFQNQESAAKVILALKADDLEREGFEPLEKPKADIARAVELSAMGPRPVVFVVPGIMGSELCADGDRVWLDIPDLIFGGFKQLKIDAPNVKPTQVLSRYYGDLIEYLSASHKVIPFPFDWRLPIENEADRLAQNLEREYRAARQHNLPVRILAHSMGGLVVRCMIGRHKALWDEICRTEGARLVMLGTPNGGSHCITELLVGQSSTLRQLALLDLQHNKEDLLCIISRFPGVLAMLPKDQREDYFSFETWKRYHEKAGRKWVLPDADDLDRAREFRRLIDNSPVDPERTIYVAGCADVTPAEMFLETEGEESYIGFLATSRGDGRVPWASGIPDGIPSWYMNVEHGDMAAYPEAFRALKELLETGSTTLLPKSPPLARAAVELFPMPVHTDEMYPDEEILAATALGAGKRKRRIQYKGENPVYVRVVYGDLNYASYPLAVGHYAGDTIVGAEKQLDQALSGALTRRYHLGIYPGAIESSAVFINPNPPSEPSATPKGAIVIGLGGVGNLSAPLLTRTVTRALLEYMTEWGEHAPGRNGGLGGDNRRELGVSTLLIGTGAGGISISDSVYAFLRGVRRVNRVLRDARLEDRIRYVEFVDLSENRAMLALKALKKVEAEFTATGAFIFEETLNRREGGISRAEVEEGNEWWQRLQILGGVRDGDSDGTLRFSTITRRARSEVRLLATQKKLVDRFITQSVRTTADNRDVARTFFELLLPNELKEMAPSQDRVILIVDEEAAGYPWELMEDPWSETRTPLVIEKGVLRQLESWEFREIVRGVTKNVALVIGDPVSKFPELRGAQEEARTVAATLQYGGLFQVRSHLRPRGEEVITALFGEAYRVLHLAGHGVYRFEAEVPRRCGSCGQVLPQGNAAELQKRPMPVTGMIIGDDLVLTPREVHQMRYVPELVFINCCHLGYIEPGGEKDPGKNNLHNDYHRIATNVATEFIRMGVCAVVAAGWAVDDGAAKTFATSFYRGMLQGGSFGEVVHETRRITWENHPHTNTWGAYQCYGDPDYRLIRTTSGG